MSWFKKEKIVLTDKQLQDELKALCQKIILKQYSSSLDENRYEKLLYEIYKRNLIPEMTLSPRKNEK